MKPFRKSRTAALLAAGVSALLMAGPSSALDANDKAEIETIIREYLLKNPELLLEVQQAYEAKRDAEQKVAQKGTIDTRAAEIFHSPDDVAVGNPNGSVTIVEFHDYNCGYCKRALDDMTTMIEADNDLRFVLKEFPILGPDSLKAHHVARAFKKLLPEKYFEFHVALMGGEGRATEESAMELAVSLGAEEGKMREIMDAEDADAEFRQAYDLANGLGITGTPSYVIGDEVVFGALGRDVLTAKVDNMRSCNSATC
ncbi:MAG TPA: DsbA family protein [Rhizobiaceae bacterium]|nr:DsbA family protein [Rhizobiaceae bacterium]